MFHLASPQDIPQTDDLFQTRLDKFIDMGHELVIASRKMQWEVIAEHWGALPMSESTGGNPALPVRLIAGLFYLKHAFNVSDEYLCEHWAENAYWQYFCGEVYFQTKPPCDPTSLIKYRNRLGHEKLQVLFTLTIHTAKSEQFIKNKDLEDVIVNSTVQEKAIAYPTDSRLLEVARHKLVKFAKQEDIKLRRSYSKEAKILKVKAGKYAHARQFKRMAKAIKRQKTIVGAILRDIQRKLEKMTLDQNAMTYWTSLSENITKLLAQEKKSKNKIYALHALEVECISKGKIRSPYEFGVKIGLAVTQNKNLVVGVKKFTGNPYDGDTLEEQLKQVEKFTQIKLKTASVDLGYRGRDATIPEVKIIHRGKYKTLTPREKKLLKRRQSIEPVIGHIKADCRMDRNFLKGAEGDEINALLSATGYNLRWLLRQWLHFCLYFIRILQRKYCGFSLFSQTHAA